MLAFFYKSGKLGLINCQAQFQLPSSVQVQLRAEIDFIIIVRPTPATNPLTPPHPGKYIWATSRLLVKLKTGMEALFNQTRSTS